LRSSKLEEEWVLLIFSSDGFLKTYGLKESFCDDCRREEFPAFLKGIGS